jgi:hypothetical protein
VSITDRIKAGDRIRLIEMPDDPAPIEPGSLGTVISVVAFPQNEYQIMMKWDSGRTLNLCEIDRWEKIA